MTSQFSSEVGRLFLFIGPMFSRKTSRLLAELSTYADLQISVAYINHSLDERETQCEGNGVTTHNCLFKGLPDKITSLKSDKLSSLNLDRFDVIGIDEAQFFPDLISVV